MTFNIVPVNDYKTVMVDGAQLIDVREPNEVAAGTIEGSVNIPLGSLPGRIGELDQSRPVVMLCRSGGRSANASAFLVEQGFATVTNLEGGMLAFTG